MLTSSFGFGSRPLTNNADGEESSSAGGMVAKKYFKAWNIKTGSKDIKEKLQTMVELASAHCDGTKLAWEKFRNLL